MMSRKLRHFFVILALIVLSINAPVLAATTILVDDSLPAGASDLYTLWSLPGGLYPFNWTTSPVWSGQKAHYDVTTDSDFHEHAFLLSSPITVPVGAVFRVWVYMDPNSEPQEIMIQFREPNVWWEHRAYWGANLINAGTDSTASRRYMGPLPEAGSWVRLDIPASTVGLEGKSMDGIAYAAYGGIAYFDWTLLTDDNAAPSVPTGLTVTGTTSTSVSLSWIQNTETDLRGYIVYRDGVPIALIEGSVTSFTDTGVIPSTTYSYTIASVDTAGNVSAQSSSVIATTARDNIAPANPVGFKASIVGLNTVILNWTASAERDVVGYVVYRNGIEAAMVDQVAGFIDYGLMPATNYQYTISAIDSSGNVSIQSRAISVRTAQLPSHNICSLPPMILMMFFGGQSICPTTP